MKTYEVITATYPHGPDNPPQYARLCHRDKTEWKTKRTAKKHAREYKARHMRDAWVQEA